VNNCEDDICLMFNHAFRELAQNKMVDLFPSEIESEQAKLSGFIYDNINNGVYKAGFATRQRAYEMSCRSYSLSWKGGWREVATYLMRE
jgi:glutathionyl-hydroquinone reductase